MDYSAPELPLMPSKTLLKRHFLPSFGLNAANKGESEYTVRSLLYNGVYTTRTIPLGEGKMNRIYANYNQYVFTFRIFKSYKYNKELGFAWQIRSDGDLNYTNESLAIFDSYKRFNSDVPYNNLFNNHGYNQSYHQFSITYRENYDKRLAFGLKLSLLSGINYNKVDINESSLFYHEDGLNSTLILECQVHTALTFYWKKNLTNDFYTLILKIREHQ
jgi:hypothetical protein